MILGTLLLILFVFVTIFYKKHLKQYSDVYKLPGPSTIKSLQHLYFNSSTKSFAVNLLKLHESYGPTIILRINPLKPTIITSDMEFCNKILKCKDFHCTPSFKEVKLMGDGFPFTLHYEKWKTHKQLISKSFNTEYIVNKLSLYNRMYDNLLHMIRSSLGKPFDMQNALDKLFINIMLRSFEVPNVEITEDERSTYSKLATDFYNLLAEKLNSFHMIGVLHKFTKNYKLQEEIILNTLKFGERWLQRFKDVDESSRDEYNLAYKMLNSGMSDTEVLDTVNTLILAGHDTSSFPMSMFFREMAEHPELQQKIVAEIWSTIGMDVSLPITKDDIDKMPYLQAAVKEAIRRYNPLPFVDRELTYDVTVGNIKIPKGTNVIFNLPGVLTSEKNYDDPLTFKPERFLKESTTLKGQRAFIGFGYGAKICPAKHLSYAALKLFVVKVIREFEVCPVDPVQEIKVTSAIVFRSSNGISVVFRKRILNK